MEDNKVDLLNLKLEEVTKQRNFFWDSFILSIALFISGLSVTGIIDALFSDDNSVACFIKSNNRIKYNFINSYCYKDVPNIKHFPVIVLSQSVLLFAPHYAWKAIFRAKIESFLSHTAKVEILREKDTGKYPYHNYTIVKYLQREFSDSYNISFSYVLKLALQLVSVIISFVINVVVFLDIYSKDITFMCKDDNQLFDKLFENYSNESLDSVTCTYPRRALTNVLVWIDYGLVFLVAIMLIYGLNWILHKHSKQNPNYTIADFCYNSCIDSQYCYKLSKEIYIRKDWFQIRDDFTFLLASLDSGYRRVFNTILIENIISRIFSKYPKKLDEEKYNHTKNFFYLIKKHLQALCPSSKCVASRGAKNNQVHFRAAPPVPKEQGNVVRPQSSPPMLQGQSQVVPPQSAQQVSQGQGHVVRPRSAPLMLQGHVDYTLLSEFIPDLCKDITESWDDKSNLAILDIASGYHSYMHDISKRCKEKVVSVILGTHHERKIQTIENSEPSIVVISMKTSLNKPKDAEIKFTDELYGYIGGDLNLIVVGPLDSEHKQSTVNQIVNTKKLFRYGAVMLVIKLIKLGKKDISDNFFDCNPDMSSWKQNDLNQYKVIKKGNNNKLIEGHSSTYEVTVHYQGFECYFQLKSYYFTQQEG